MALDEIKIGLVSAGFGIIGTLLSVGFGIRPLVNEARIFQREEGKPAIMRTYKSGSDGLLIQDMENKGRYIPLNIYLQNIQNEADKQIEKATIKKVAEWYKTK